MAQVVEGHGDEEHPARPEDAERLAHAAAQALLEMLERAPREIRVEAGVGQAGRADVAHRELGVGEFPLQDVDGRAADVQAERGEAAAREMQRPVAQPATAIEHPRAPWKPVDPGRDDPVFLLARDAVGKALRPARLLPDPRPLGLDGRDLLRGAGLGGGEVHAHGDRLYSRPAPLSNP